MDVVEGRRTGNPTFIAERTEKDFNSSHSFIAGSFVKREGGENPADYMKGEKNGPILHQWAKKSLSITHSPLQK